MYEHDRLGVCGMCAAYPPLASGGIRHAAPVTGTPGCRATTYKCSWLGVCGICTADRPSRRRGPAVRSARDWYIWLVDWQSNNVRIRLYWRLRDVCRVYPLADMGCTSHAAPVTGTPVLICRATTYESACIGVCGMCAACTQFGELGARGTPRP